jgi:hypothetical protein
MADYESGESGETGDYDSYIHTTYKPKHTVANWYNEDTYAITISIRYLTNEIVNDPEFLIPFNYNKMIRLSFVDYYQTHVDYYYNENPSVFDINNLFAKMPGLKHITFAYNCYLKSQITMLPVSIEKIDCIYQTIENLEKYTNLKHYNFSNTEEIFVIPQFADGLETISIECKSIDGSFCSLPQSVKTINLQIENMNSSLDMWPSNLQKLNIVINNNTNGYTIEMLPHSLESFSLYSVSYLNYIDFPPYLKLLHFLTHDINSPYIVNIPESVVNYAINYESLPEIDRLPKKCKTFTYIGCPPDIHKNLRKNVKGVAFYTSRIKNFSY